MSYRIEELVERQVRRWEINQRLSTPSRAPLCVALSRLPHSGAAELAQRVAEKLDYGFFGIEIVDRIARERGIHRQLVTGLDEHVRSKLDRYVLDSFRERTFNESDYLQLVVRTIATLGAQGMAVILGRGAPFVLGSDRALRVLVVASRVARSERLAKKLALSAEAATARLALEDSERLEFLTQFGVDANDPTLYDLIVNTETLGVDAAVTIVVDALRARSSRVVGAAQIRA